VAQPAPQTQFIALAGLRGVAALVVVQWHGQSFLGGPLIAHGYLAVDFFFLLSGWVLAHAYDRRLQKGLSGVQFMRLRLIRLYPVYLLALLLMYAGWSIGGHSIVPGPLLALLFLPDLLVAGSGWVIGPAWSPAAELAANIPFAFLHRGLTARVLVITIGLALLWLVWWAATHGSLDLGYASGTRIGLFPRVFFAFPLGVLLYRHRAALTRWAPTWSAWPAAILLVLGLGIPSPSAATGWFDLLIVAFLLPAVLIFASRAQPDARTTIIATTLGTISYPLYLLHFPAFSAVDALLQALQGRDIATLPLVPGLLLVAAVLLISWLVDRHFDQPLRRWLSGKPPEPRVPASASLAE